MEGNWGPCKVYENDVDDKKHNFSNFAVLCVLSHEMYGVDERFWKVNKEAYLKRKHSWKLSNDTNDHESVKKAWCKMRWLRTAFEKCHLHLLSYKRMDCLGSAKDVLLPMNVLPRPSPWAVSNGFPGQYAHSLSLHRYNFHSTTLETIFIKTFYGTLPHKSTTPYHCSRDPFLVASAVDRLHTNVSRAQCIILRQQYPLGACMWRRYLYLQIMLLLQFFSAYWERGCSCSNWRRDFKSIQKAGNKVQLLWCFGDLQALQPWRSQWERF